MKIVAGILMFLGLQTMAQAIPVVNENSANSGVITIYPDSADPNHFYIAPNVVTLAKDGKGRPVFSYVEYHESLFSKKALVQMTLVPYYTQKDLDQAEKQILAANPKAQFSGLPFSGSQIDFADALAGLIETQSCLHETGLIGQEMSCSFTLSPQGRSVFLALLNRRILITTMNYHYHVSAVIRNAQGGFQPYDLDHGIAARIDGAQILAFPELIVR